MPKQINLKAKTTPTNKDQESWLKNESVAIRRLTINLDLDTHSAFKSLCSSKGKKITEVVEGWVIKAIEDKQI